MLPRTILQTILVIACRDFYIHTQCLFLFVGSLFVPVLTPVEWWVMMLFCHRVWTVRGKARCHGLLCRHPVISQLSSGNTTQSPLSRAEWDRSEKLGNACICIREGDRGGGGGGSLFDYVTQEDVDRQPCLLKITGVDWDWVCVCE